MKIGRIQDLLHNFMELWNFLEFPRQMGRLLSVALGPF